MGRSEEREQTRTLHDEFVAPPSCWFDTSPLPAGSSSNTTCDRRSRLNSSGSNCYDDEVHETEQYRNGEQSMLEAKETIHTEQHERQAMDNQEGDRYQQRKETKEVEDAFRQNPSCYPHHRRDSKPIPAISGLRSAPSSCGPCSGSLARMPPGADSVVVGNTRPSPSWQEISSQVLPAAARELLSSSIRRIYYTARISYSKGRWHRKYSDMGHDAGGFSVSPSSNLEFPHHLSELPPFSSLPWVDRQLVREWRTYLPETPQGVAETEDFDFEQARTLVPTQIARPVWQKADVCKACHKPFGPLRLRHHCRSCGHSFCQDHSQSIQRLPHLGYDSDVPERVCDTCKRILEEQNLAERVVWRLARCRDHTNDRLTPYFETGIDSAEAVALRLTNAAIAMAKSIPLGAQATIAVDTVDVLRKYGLHGIYGIILRQEFLAAADLLRKALGINKSSWPLSVHELSAAIFYALAQHRAMRGLSPDREHTIHRFRSATVGCQGNETPAKSRVGGTRTPAVDPATSHVRGRGCNNVPMAVDSYELSALDFRNSPVVDETDTYNPVFSNYVKLDEKLQNPVQRDPRQGSLASTEIDGQKHTEMKHGQKQQQQNLPLPNFTPVCDPVPDKVLGSLIFYAPIALNFIYATKEVEMQLLAGQQGWRLLYAYLHQDTDSLKTCDRPASAMFVHREHKIACLSVRGTATINDVITDIRQTPVPFPNIDLDRESSENEDGDWTNIDRGQGLALCGMVAAASNLFSEHIDSLIYFVKQGYRIRLVGHSLGGGVATMIGVLVLRYLEQLGYSNPTDGSNSEDIALLKVYAYGTPSCFDSKLANLVDSFVTTVVLHDDVFPRLTPTSCRGLLKHLLYIRETWVEKHIQEDLRAVGERARKAWAPRLRQNFALRSSTKSIKKYCKKQILRGKGKLMSVRNDAMTRASNATSDIDIRDIRGNNSRDECSEFAEIESLTSDPSEWGEKFFVPTTNLSMSSSNDETDKHEKVIDETELHDSEAQLLLEFLGAGDNRKEGVIIDGDEFFEPEGNFVADSVDESQSIGGDHFSDPIGELTSSTTIQSSDSWSLDINGNEFSSEKNHSSVDNDNENDRAAVVLDESPLHRMFLPGKVVHIYSHRGVYKAAYVPRTFKELRRISLAGNMLSNHTTKSYFESLLEVQTVRTASESPPKWTAYDEDDTCCCCANRFTWASTSNSEAQEARDKHNCRSCGGLICDPCSKNRVPIPSIGLTVPVRVCDRCYNDIMGGVSAASSSMTSSVIAADEDEQAVVSFSTSETSEEENKKPERIRQKRSAVVDDLVSKMRSSALT